MPSSKPASTKAAKVTTEQLDELVGATPITYDPAIAAAIMRSMGNLEIELFRSGLTRPQQKLLGRIRHYRSILWRMIPEGS